MRLWHKDLISLLPRQQLLGQWRECCLIAKNIHNNGTPNHLLVNKIMDYPLCHFWTYSMFVADEMKLRGYKVDISKLKKLVSAHDTCIIPYHIDLFNGWHNDRYYYQCLMNLQEKYDCGGISEEEYRILVNNTGIEDL